MPLDPNRQQEIVANVLTFEGGFQDSPDDAGNKDSQGNIIGTNRGITPFSYNTAFGKEPSKDELKNLSEVDAIKIYNENYWKPNRISEMPDDLQEITMNMFVMTSPRNAIKALQRASGAKEDGVLGPQTLKALRGTSKEDVWEEYHNHLKKVKSYPKHKAGWVNRYEAILKR